MSFTNLSNFIQQTTNYTLLISDSAVGFDCSGASRTATLPAASTAQVGKPFFIRRTDSVFTNFLTIATTGGDTIDGRASLSIILSPGDSMTFVSTGTAWICLQLKETISIYGLCTSGQSMIANTMTTVIWNATGWDTHGMLNNANGVITAKVAGYYRFEAAFYTTTAAQTAFANLTSPHITARVGERVATGSPGQFGGALTVYLNVGETVTLGVQSTGTTPLSTSGALNYFTCAKVG